MSSVLMVLADDHEEQADQEGELKEPNEEEQEEDKKEETKEGRSTRLFKTLFEQTKDDIFWNPPLYSGKYVGLGVGVADTAFFKKMNISIEWIIRLFFEWIKSLNEYFAVLLNE